MAQLSTELDDGVLLVTFENPPDGLMNNATTEELLALLARLEDDEAIRCVVFTGGIDGVFIRHFSIADLADFSDALRRKGRTFDESAPVDDHPLNQICRRLEALGKPTIAAINGHAMGGGWELAMATDIRLAEAGDYALGLPEANVGILPGAGGTQRLARLVGTARALEMTLRGRTVAPDEALALGMVHEVAPAPVRERALAIARELAAKPPRALAHIKRLVRAALPAIDPATLQLESRLFLDLLVSDDANRLMKKMLAGARDIRDV